MYLYHLHAMNVQNAMWPDNKSWGEHAGELVTSNSMYWVGLESKMGHEEKTNKQTNKTNKHWLVVSTPLKKYESQLDGYSQYMEK